MPRCPAEYGVAGAMNGLVITRGAPIGQAHRGGVCVGVPPAAGAVPVMRVSTSSTTEATFQVRRCGDGSNMATGSRSPAKRVIGQAESVESHRGAARWRRRQAPGREHPAGSTRTILLSWIPHPVQAG